jgi:hypothetical protein
MEIVIDILLVGIVGLVTFLVAQDGPWNAILTMFAVIFGGLLAMNFFEPLAVFVSKQIPSQESRADIICLLGLFALFVFLIRLGLEQLTPSNPDLPDLVFKIGQWGFGLATGYITMAIILTSLHTAPLPRKFFGFTPERPNFLGVSRPDVQWLGFTQHVTEHVFARRFIDRTKGEVAFRNFDGQRHQFPGKQESDYLATFIIRYATRRQRLSGQGSTATQPAIVIPSTSKGQPTVGPGL